MELFVEKFPKTVDGAIHKILSDMTFGDKTRIANMSESGLVKFHESYGVYLRQEFRLPGNTPLMTSCRELSGLGRINAFQASYVILKSLQAALRKENVLKVVK